MDRKCSRDKRNSKKTILLWHYKQNSKKTSYATCSKNCACYLERAVADIKKKVAIRLDALKAILKLPKSKFNLSPSERALLEPSRSEPPHDVCVVVRKYVALEHEIADILGDHERIAREADRFAALKTTLADRLVEANAALELLDSRIDSLSSSPEIHIEEDKEEAEKLSRATKILERSRERTCKMEEMLETITGCYRKNKEIRSLFDLFAKDKELNWAALQMALQALERLVEEINHDEQTRLDADVQVHFEDQDE